MQTWEYCQVVDFSYGGVNYKKGIYVIYPDGTMQVLIDMEKVKGVEVGGGHKQVDPLGINFLRALNALGDAGWEVIGSRDWVLLKRPKQG